MQNSQTTLPDNLLSKFSRIYVSKNSFVADDGKNVDYQRFCLDYQIKGETLTIEIPIKKDSPVTSKDLMLLQIADNFDSDSLNKAF